MKEFLTENQHVIIKGCLHARDKSVLVGLISPSGVGMKHALGTILKKYPYERIIYADVQYSGVVSEVCVSLIRVCSNVRFSNLNYKKAELFDLVRILKDRMKKDIKGNPLIVLDNVWALSNEQMKYLNSFLTIYGGTCGIVLRTTKRKLGKFRRAYPEVFDKFYNHTMNEWLVLNKNTDKEIARLITTYGIKDKLFIHDVAAQTKSFTRAKKFIDKYLDHLR
jgi:hypothetical protein